MRFRIAVIVAVLMLPAPVSGQETPFADALAAITADTFDPPQFLADRVPHDGERRWLKGCLAFNIFGATFDAVTTHTALRLPGTHETGILIAPGIRAHGARAIWTVKAGFAALSTLIYILVADDHPRLAASAACGTGAIGTAAGVSNKRLIRTRGMS